MRQRIRFAAKRTAFAGSFLVLACSVVVAADELFDVVSDGYQVVHKEPYLSFEGCEYDKAYALGPYVFVCSGYDYDYTYGPAVVLGSGSRYYLCTEDGKCYDGVLYQR